MTSAQDKVSSEWDAMAGEWDDLAATYRDGFVRVLYNFITTDSLVLDFGCGTGLLTDKLRENVSQVICVDPAPQMIAQVKEKIRAGEWRNVQAYCSALAHLKDAPENIQHEMRALEGKVDLIVASSVLSFIPEQDVTATMIELGSLLRPNGCLLHSDWPKSETHPDGFTEQSALKFYEIAGLEKKSANLISIDMGGERHPVLFGVAVKRQQKSYAVECMN
jgi:SAM-dependent methyltransferase